MTRMISRLDKALYFVIFLLCPFFKAIHLSGKVMDKIREQTLTVQYTDIK